MAGFPAVTPKHSTHSRQRMRDRKGVVGHGERAHTSGVQGRDPPNTARSAAPPPRPAPPRAARIFRNAPRNQPGACFRDHAKGVECRCRSSVSRCKFRHQWLVPGVPGLPGSTRAQHTDAESSTPIGRSPRSGLLAGGRRVVRGVARRDRSTLEVARCVPAVTESWSRPVLTCATWVKTLSASPDQGRLCVGDSRAKKARSRAEEHRASAGAGVTPVHGTPVDHSARERTPASAQPFDGDWHLEPFARQMLPSCRLLGDLTILATQKTTRLMYHGRFSRRRGLGGLRETFGSPGA